MTSKNVPKKGAPTASKGSIERVTTGIMGLDKSIEGGFVKGSVVLLTGGTGTGKTTFCTQFLLEGLKKGEPGIYITFEEDPDDIRADVERYGFDFSPYEKKGIFKFVYQNPFEVSDITSTVVDAINSINAKRAVLDPISLMGMYVKDPAVLRKRLFGIIRMLKKTNVTSIITSEILDGDMEEERGNLSREGVTEFVADSVIVLQHVGIGGESFGNLQIRKMRRTKHEHGWFPTNITKSGLTVSKDETSTLLK
jgi:circadian clock protein KaiC